MVFIAATESKLNIRVDGFKLQQQRISFGRCWKQGWTVRAT